jgi:ectoine hydroxylase-related dioxygenase (phytanoyl-CoA dioxygenase family)
MISLDPYAEDNGATVVVTKSHKWGPERVPTREEAVPVVMPRGSIVYFLGTLWHGGGQNRSAHERRALTVQYCQPWVRPIENQTLAVDFEKLPEIPKQIVDMLGYQVCKPFIGFADGRSPLKAAQKHLGRWKRGVAVQSTIRNPSFATTPLSPGKIKKAPPKLTNFTYMKVSLNG